jgi:pectinesterase
MRSLLISIGLVSVLPAFAAAPGAAVTARNPIDLARPSETIVLDAAELRQLLAVDDVRRVHVRDERAAKDLLVQAVDTNDDGAYEQLLFQVDFAPKETRTLLLSVGERQIARAEDYKTYGRFVRERRDDFAWENDRIAHRMYGKELETWPQEPLISSAVDVWSKRVRKLVVNDWYMVDDYHRDHGEGGDFYSAGSSRGCGGSGIWAGGKLYPSANSRHSRVFAVGPIRVLFELTYEAWTAGGVRVSEKKRISLDAGHNLDRFESHYSFEGSPAALAHAIGIKKGKGSQIQADRARGLLRTWEPVPDGGGQLGCGVLVDPAQVADLAQDDRNFLIVAKIAPASPSVYYAGFGWTKSGDFATVEDWDRYLSDSAARLRAPLEIRIEKR